MSKPTYPTGRIELRHVIDSDSARDKSLVLAAKRVFMLLKDDPVTADKPFEEILDPAHEGMFAFEPRNGSEQWLGFVSQRQLQDEPEVREISSLIVEPAYREQKIGSWLLMQYADALQTEWHPHATLVALASDASRTQSPSLPLFEASGFSVMDEAGLGELPTEFAQRASKIGKIPVLREATEPMDVTG